jgi:hypothetical protein
VLVLDAAVVGDIVPKSLHVGRHFSSLRWELRLTDQIAD